MINCIINDCKNNQSFKCTLKDLTLNVDMKCVCFEFANKRCKMCDSEFKPKNGYSKYCSIKCRNLYNIRIHRRKLDGM